MKYNCPKCGISVDSQKDPAFPFCTKRCQMMDLGAWASEEYKISRPVSEQDLDTVD